MPQIQRGTDTTLADINMVPFIDVVLVLLIIFMITAPILQSGIEVDVPKTKTVKELTEVRQVVTIDRAQRVYLNDKPVNIHDLGQQVMDQSRHERSRASGGLRSLRRNGALRQLGHRGRCAAPGRNPKRKRGDATAQPSTLKCQLSLQTSHSITQPTI